MNRRPALSRRLLLPLFGSLLLVAGCASVESGPAPAPVAAGPVALLAVLPAEPFIDPDVPTSAETREQLETGSEVANGALAQYFSGSKTARLVSPEQVAGRAPVSAGNRQALLREIGSNLGADAVLAVTVRRYVERGGGEYAVKQPASAAFDYVLLEVESGKLLCGGTFDETQQPLSSNLFSFGKAAARGFKWVTPARLLQDGLTDRLDNCAVTREAVGSPAP